MCIPWSLFSNFILWWGDLGVVHGISFLSVNDLNVKTGEGWRAKGELPGILGPFPLKMHGWSNSLPRQEFYLSRLQSRLKAKLNSSGEMKESKIWLCRFRLDYLRNKLRWSHMSKEDFWHAMWCFELFFFFGVSTIGIQLNFIQLTNSDRSESTHLRG